MQNPVEMSSFQLSNHSKFFQTGVAFLLIIGVLSRVTPLLNQGGRLLKQFPTEDGYLMLTIARNLALGQGMSTADGTIPTNGTQPLFTLMEALGFALVGGEKIQGVAIALVFQLGISLIAAGFLLALALEVMRGHPQRWAIATLSAGLWYASPLTIPNTMNCLETGLYAALVIMTVFVWYRHETQPCSRQFSPWVISVGILLGLTTWARIDAVFLIGAIALWHILLHLKELRQKPYKYLTESLVMTSLAVLIISPWLINNKLRFGRFTPISGLAQSQDATFGQNFSEVPSKIFEYATLIFPIPQSIEKNGFVLLGTMLLVLGYIALLVVVAIRANRDRQAFILVTSTYAGLLMVYYGLFFGAAHFVGRYLFPVSAFTSLFAIALLFWSLERLKNLFPMRRLIPLGGLMALALITALNLRLYAQGAQHMHFPVVNWVEQNLDQKTWVGAVQTGTLGFFHDRTINLDGKVNPEALAAKLEQKVPDYVTYQTFDPQGGKINYLVDWIGIASWIEKPPLDTHFELIVADRKQNLAVLRRKG